MILSVYITCKDQEEANRVSEYLISKKLIACSNVFPIQSQYWWQGDIVKEGEYACLVKTTTELWDSLQVKILEVHSYDVPCIVKYEVEANNAYEAWVKESVRQA